MKIDKKEKNKILQEVEKACKIFIEKQAEEIYKFQNGFEIYSYNKIFILKNKDTSNKDAYIHVCNERCVPEYVEVLFEYDVINIQNIYNTLIDIMENEKIEVYENPFKEWEEQAF